MQRGVEEKRRGYSLIELMVVILLLGIMTAVILPEMGGSHQEALLRSSGRELVSVLRLAYSQAITVNRPHHFCIDPREGRYWLETMAPDGEDGETRVPVRKIPGCAGQLDSRISIQIRRPGRDPRGESRGSPGADSRRADSGRADARGTPDTTIAFHTDGTAEAREILLRDEDGFALALRINPATARVRLHTLGREGVR